MNLVISSMLSVLLIGCGSGGKKELFGVYETKHAGIDFNTGQQTTEEFTYEYSFLPNGACVYYDGQKDMIYYTCTYKQNADNTYSTEVLLRASDNKTLRDSITVQKGNSFDALNTDTSEVITYKKSNKKLDTQSMVDMSQYSDAEKTIQTVVQNYCKNSSGFEYYKQNSKIPTMDSVIKGLGTPQEMNDKYSGYIYPIQDKKDATDMVRAYCAAVMATTDCDVSKKDGMIWIKGGSGMTMALAAGNDDDLGYCFMVIFANI